jgi:hypothetical protein
MQRRRVAALLASAVIGGASVLQAGPTGNQRQSSESHIAWVADVLENMQTIKPGMTRKTLLKVFTTEGGLSPMVKKLIVAARKGSLPDRRLMPLPAHSTSADHPVVPGNAQFRYPRSPLDSARGTGAGSACPGDCAPRGNGPRIAAGLGAAVSPRTRSGIPVSPISPSVPHRRSNSDSGLVGHGFHPSSLDQLTEREAELAVPIMQQISAVGQKSPLLHRHVAPHLLHPRLVRMGRDSSQTNPPTLQLDKEQHVVGNQAFKRSSNSRTKSRPPSDVTRDPWKSTFNEGLKES